MWKLLYLQGSDDDVANDGEWTPLRKASLGSMSLQATRIQPFALPASVPVTASYRGTVVCWYSFCMGMQALRQSATSKFTPHTVMLTMPSIYPCTQAVKMLGPPTLTTSGCHSLQAGPSTWCHPTNTMDAYFSQLISLVTDNCTTQCRDVMYHPYYNIIQSVLSSYS